MKITALETIECDAGWRNYYFVKISTDKGITGWSEYDEGFGSPGVGAIIEKLKGRLIGQSVNNHEQFFQLRFFLLLMLGQVLTFCQLLLGNNVGLIPLQMILILIPISKLKEAKVIISILVL